MHIVVDSHKKEMKKFLSLTNEYQLKNTVLNKCSIILFKYFNGAWNNDHVYRLLEKQF